MAISRFSFLSATLGYHVNVCVLLPTTAGAYDLPQEVSIPKKKYQTLYLLHGGGGSCTDWVRNTRIERLAEKYQLAVVMPEMGLSFYADMHHGQRYFTYLTEELPKLMEFLFPLSARREDRFVAGFSMGGYGTLKWALNKPDFFSAAAAMSGASLTVEFFETNGYAGINSGSDNSWFYNTWGTVDMLRGSDSDTRALLERVSANQSIYPRLFCCTGTEDQYYPFTKDFMACAETLGVKIDYEESPGGHDWDYIDAQIGRVLDWFALKKAPAAAEVK